MWLWYDWRAAAVADENGNIVDSMEWTGHMTEHAVVERLRKVSQGQRIREAEELHQRFPEAVICVHGDTQLPDADWPLPNAEQQAAADAAALRLAVEGVQAAASDPDRRLEHLVRGSDELRANHLTMESRLLEWAGLFFPMTVVTDRSAYVRTVAQSDTPEAFAQAMGVDIPPSLPSEAEWRSLQEWGENTAQAQYFAHLGLQSQENSKPRKLEKKLYLFRKLEKTQQLKQKRQISRQLKKTAITCGNRSAEPSKNTLKIIARARSHCSSVLRGI